MKAIVKNTKKEIEVTPYYLYGRVVAYVSDNVVEGIDFGGKYAWLPDEIDLDIYYGG
jgi:hypothetical protein